MEKVVQLPRPQKGEVFTYLILNDVHDFQSSQRNLDLAYRTFKSVPIEQRRILLLGDILDFPWLMKKNPEFGFAIKTRDFDDFFCPKMDETCGWFDEFYSRLVTLVEPGPDKIFYMQGNHEQRLTRPEFQIPMEYKHHFNLFKRLKCEERQIRLFSYNMFWEIEVENESNLLLTHGMYCGANPIKKHVDAVHMPVAFGHTHEVGIRSFKGVNETIIAYNLPCSCIMDPEYLSGKVNNWSEGFSFLSVDYYNWFLNPFVTKGGSFIAPWGAKFRA